MHENRYSTPFRVTSNGLSSIGLIFYFALTIGLSLVFIMYAKTSVAAGNTAGRLDFALTVYKSPTCGCCGKWIEHMEAAGFRVQQEDHVDISPVKKRYNIKPQFQSCHTAVFAPEGYFFEGHIPADVIKRFLKEKPEGAAGLVVQGMPPGSPGMEYGDVKIPYDVYLLTKDGNIKVFQHVD